MLMNIVLLSFLGLSTGLELQLFSDSPVVLDAPITFTGVLSGADPDELYRWKWTDDTSPGHTNTSDHKGTETIRNFTVTYPTDQYDQMKSTMKLVLFKFNIFYWETEAIANVHFEVTRSLSGRLLVKQNGQQSESMDGNSVINSLSNTEIVIDFHDPSNFLEKASQIKYFWFIDTVLYGQTNKGVFSYNFSTPGEYEVETNVIADFNSSSRNHSLASVNRKVFDQRGEGVKMGIFQKKIVSKAPIKNLTVAGQKTLKHGQLVDLQIACDGTGPWLFCWKIVAKGYNITGNETCSDPQYRKVCDFSIMWYFKSSDTYNLLVIVSNDVSSHLEVVSVTIYEVASSLPLSIVIFPVISAIIAIVILISGIGFYTSLKHNLAVEVADFDFNTAEEEELQFKTFWERLRDSFGTAFTSGSDSESDGSSISGRRSVQIPGPSGLGYGSIT
ncbi:uncharacterized protein LOC111715712 [Eurytemora carolleeae]|uniref:uncharacterized protein LOC111715712 n=1 Tax=Eurytemora carolleeae TaxID=1294199 RepID=UPI000C78620E|nr:uncharacterized protein LOC111715712 [Eurytemora carolleeae]XP_023346844.1 uncharacterized protein LOC111715712 [Eurytemora carolleeae]|eukprot:XP_023346843.1 uncharacterized protein LOC111715712 [Eurytemora affinis]